VEQDVADYLELKGVLGTPPNHFAITYGNMPDAPDDHITTYQYQGGPGLEVHNKPGIAYGNPGLQVRIRAKGYDRGRNKAYDVYHTLQVTDINIGGRHYQRIMPSSSPFLLERDAKDRVIFLVNLAVMTTEG